MARLELIRRQKLLSQAALAARSGVSESTIYAIEGGRSKSPRLQIMRKLCDALGVEPADIDEFRAPIGLSEPERAKAAAA